jgi:hypothetical protein
MNERERISNPGIKTRKQFKMIVPGEDAKLSNVLRRISR